MNATLPSFTLFFIQLSGYIKSYSLAILITIIISLFISIKYYKKTVLRCLARLPLFGKLLTYNQYARCFMQLATLLCAGIPLLSALKQCQNEGLQRYIHFWISRIEAGHLLSDAMRDCSLPNLISARIAIAESSGTLDETCQALATHFENESDILLNRLGELIEPIIMIVLGLSIGSMMIAMYLPIFYLGQGF